MKEIPLSITLSPVEKSPLSLLSIMVHVSLILLSQTRSLDATTHARYPSRSFHLIFPHLPLKPLFRLFDLNSPHRIKNVTSYNLKLLSYAKK